MVFDKSEPSFRQPSIYGATTIKVCRQAPCEQVLGVLNFYGAIVGFGEIKFRLVKSRDRFPRSGVKLNAFSDKFFDMFPAIFFSAL